MIDLSLDAGFMNVLRILRFFGKKHIRPADIEADRTGDPLPVDHKLFTDFNAMNLSFGLRNVGKKPSAENEGPGRTARSSIIAAEELAFWGQGATMALPGAGLGGPPVGLLGTDDQKRRFLEEPFKDKSKPAWGAYATTEPGCGSDVARIRTTAKKDGDHWILNGEKMFITNGGRASWVVIFATVDPSAGRAGQRAFVVEKGTPGFSVGRIEKKMGLTASETAGLVLEDVRVPDANLLGRKEGSKGKAGFKVAMATFDLTRPMVAMMAIGIARSAWEHARDVAKDAFGARVRTAHEILLLDRLAAAKRELDTARLLCWRAAWKMDYRQNNTVEASMAKVYSPKAALSAISTAVDVVGLAGIRNDQFVEKCFRDIKVFDIFEGTGQVQNIVLARRLLDYPSTG